MENENNEEIEEDLCESCFLKIGKYNPLLRKFECKDCEIKRHGKENEKLF